jgi:16S rRNA (cytosine1402-N4)-methyltransferase
MLARVRELLAPALEVDGSVLVDATLGLAGHSSDLLLHCPRAHLVGIDRDPHALAVAAERLAPYADRIHLVHATFDQLPRLLADLGIAHIAAAVFDLGVSSLQLDDDDRGFAYRRDVALDMRMDPTAELTAATVLMTYPEAKLVEILRRYGEERFAPRIARRIVVARTAGRMQTTADLVRAVEEGVPAAARRTGGHPAKRTFQAVRIEVNAELDALTVALPAALDALAVHGRVLVLAYHSLEDRLTKQLFAERTRANVPAGVPTIPDSHQPRFRLLTRGAERPDEQETRTNSRARSARLRAVERIREAA